MLQKTYRFRLLLLMFFSLVAFASAIARLYIIQVVQHDDFVLQAQRQQNKKIKLSPRRGDILDRNGNTLATSSFTDTIFLDTRKLPVPPGGLASDLAGLLQRTDRQILDAFWQKPARKLLVRKAPEELSKAILDLDDRYKLPVDTLVVEKHSKRYYPNGPLASHVIGFTQIDDTGDNIGLAGVELQYDSYLKGSYRDARIQVNSGRQGLSPLSDEVLESTFGNTLVLTLDEQIQMFTERALRRRVGEVQALGGIAIVLDVTTGEILAMANCPDYDLNEFSKATEVQRRNRVLTDPIEIGSVMKILTSTLLIDNGLVTPGEMVDCCGGRTVIDGRRFTDSHPIGVVPFRHAFAESSNIAMATLGLRLAPPVYYKGLVRFGLGRPTGIDLPGEGNGILYPLEKWTRLSRTSLPIGYETALTGIQVISAMAAVGNHGMRMRPHLVREVRTPRGVTLKKIEPMPLDRVCSDETCKTMLDLMEAVVTEGTGDKAAIPGYRIGGKTGTTRKSNHREDKRYVASFAGMMPIYKPRIAIYVYVDEPRVGGFYGGAIAAPVFQEIAVHAAHILGIEPDDPVAFAAVRAKMEGQGTPARLDGATSTSLMAEAAPTGDLESALFGDDLAALIPGASALPVEMFGPAPVTEGVPMPDCHRLTMPEAWALLARYGIEATMKGSGVVVRQEPPAGGLLAKGSKATIIFTHPSEAAARAGLAAPGAAAALQPALTPTPAPTSTPKPTLLRAGASGKSAGKPRAASAQ